MNLQHVNVKINVDGELGVSTDKIIEAFHRWIQEQAFDELLVDVADYRHVPNGPGILAVGLEADYTLDQADGRWGLRYNRKAALEGQNVDRILQALRSAAQACRSLEQEFDGALKFRRDEFELFINDRALAPNSPETFEACKGDLEAFLEKIGGGSFVPSHQDDARRLFGVTVTPAKALDLDAIPAAT